MTADEVKAIAARFALLQRGAITKEAALVYAGQALIDVPKLLDAVRELRVQIELFQIAIPGDTLRWRDLALAAWRKLRP